MELWNRWAFPPETCWNRPAVSAESMSDMRMYGVELDSVSGRIARQLYQKNNIAVQGFETTSFPDSFFDAVIGNVPFGQYKVADSRYDRHNFLIHDYFIARSLDLVRPGGVVAVVTSSGTMDKQNESVRKYIAHRADLLGAVRLPDNAFLRNANTGVVADILFFQKRDRMSLEEFCQASGNGTWRIYNRKHTVRKAGSDSKARCGSTSCGSAP